jgi:GH15 family glucan-1,4-alpha-glucosidase
VRKRGEKVSTSSYLAKSKEIIRANQYPTGAYIASPAFSHYRYSWLRDGTFIAYAMDRTGEHESARSFYQWCNGVLKKHEGKARRAIAAVEAGKTPLDHDLFLHTRYTVDGEEVAGTWGNFQLDGYGAWLWGLAEHIRLTQAFELVMQLRSAVELTVDYLSACWTLPNYDCWEEYGDRVHPATLAAIYGGLKAIAPCLPERTQAIEAVCEQIRCCVIKEGVADGLFTKSIGYEGVDASLLWLAVPFGLADVQDIRMVQTVHAIERELLHGWGLHRYAGDQYYGGGQWILLSAWLGWYYVQIGEREKALAIREWIESEFTDNGLPEQVQEHLLSPPAYQEWVNKAGLPAQPLLWSHAMYLVLCSELGLS